MHDMEVSDYWTGNASPWMALSVNGADPHRDLVSNPAFFDALPDCEGLAGLDIGCADGFNTRQILQRCASLVGVDPVGAFIEHGSRANAGDERIRFVRASAMKMPFHDNSFDFATAIMSLMDICDADAAIREITRVLRPGGFLQASVEHPLRGCVRRRWVRDDDGARTDLAVSGYFDQGESVDRTSFYIDGKKTTIAIPRFRRTLSGWVDLFLSAGLQLEALLEPRPPVELRKDPDLSGASKVPYYLILRGRLT